ncbi:DUF6461 domain-containing protein [Nonomuraea sp. NPDC047897]|uniref:DUF6461 domain-containing protein n=1 Tax=Nonomuraea sp. NPDC047897 TaxID=3364346 RepID=UPI0037201DE5
MTTFMADLSWICDSYEDGGFDFTYVRGLTPAQLITRLGGRPETFVRGDHYGPPSGIRSEPGMRIGVTTIGDWTFVIGDGRFGHTADILMPLSDGTRVISQTLLGIKAIDYFFWIENREIRFYFIAQEGYPEQKEWPDELAETLTLIDSLYPPMTYPGEGPSFVLSEQLTGIRLTKEVVTGASYLWGVIPKPHSYDCPDPWNGDYPVSRMGGPIGGRKDQNRQR